MGPDKDIDIPRVAGRSMEGQGVPAHDDILNMMLVQQREQISEVGLYFHGIDGGESRRPRCVRPGCE
ncbi:MAG: hypothetical protein QG552_3324 [Thermodesulfobacteriota bacterium]|nr:hypothetical protein [Thermodesulfobacteriota bacterium]